MPQFAAGKLNQEMDAFQALPLFFSTPMVHPQLSQNPVLSLLPQKQAPAAAASSVGTGVMQHVMFPGEKWLLTLILDTQSTGRSREALISLAQAKRNFAVDAQLPKDPPNACRLPRALPKPVDPPFLPFWAHQQDQMSLPCHRAFLGGATLCQRLPVTGATGEPVSERCGTQHPQEEPWTSTGKGARQESHVAEKEQPRGRRQEIRENLMRQICSCS